ncbi:GDP-mannose 4,6-dehydratase [Candidatus Peregrinibacteria bacterium]|nr:GDP-mannose 4,6-dehydratase [Candidatus Peregrinibacteria bacterium]
MKKKLFITGIGGFVGHYLLEEGLKNNFEVFGLDRVGSESLGKSVFCGDILDQKFLSNIISSVSPDFIIHLAGQSSIQKSYDDPELTFKINVEGTRNLLSSCKNISVKKILLISSAAVYGSPQYIPIDESHPISAESPYALSRIEQEKLVSEFSNLPIIILRAFNHTGPRQPISFALPSFAYQISRIKQRLSPPVISVGNTSVVRDFSDVRDIVRGYIMALASNKTNEVYNIGSGHGYTISEILQKLIKIADVDVSLSQDPSLVRPLEAPSFVCDYQKFHKDTGWEPKYSIDQTLRDMYDFFSTPKTYS